MFEGGGMQRAYNLRVPDVDGPVPLVVSMHGALGNADALDRVSGWPEIAEREAVALLTPGKNTKPGGIWNLDPDGQDVAYLRQLLDEVEDDVCVDLDRVYLTGFSQGGMLSLILACGEPDRFAAIAPVAGMIDIDCDDRTTPVIAFHGTADDVVGFDGVQADPEMVGYADGPSVPELAEAWDAELVVDDGGHEWPSGAAERSWEFFEEHP